MSDEKFREFQAWWADDQQSELRQSCAEGWAYAIWQASRESLVVELPKPYSEHRMVSKPERHARSSTLGEVREAIESLGLRVKP